MDKVAFIFICIVVFSVPILMIYSVYKFGVYNQENISAFVVYPLAIGYLVKKIFIIACSFEINTKIVKIFFLKKLLKIETLDNVLFYDVGKNQASMFNILIEIESKIYNMILSQDEYIRFKYFAKNNNIEFLGKDDYLAKKKSSIF